MKVFVQIVDTKSSISQTGMIEEPVQKGMEVLNAINHFIKVNNSDIEWEYNTPTFGCGRVKETTKVISIICI
jgi:hypothetical protein